MGRKWQLQPWYVAWLSHLCWACRGRQGHTLPRTAFDRLHKHPLGKSHDLRSSDRHVRISYLCEATDCLTDGNDSCLILEIESSAGGSLGRQDLAFTYMVSAVCPAAGASVACRKQNREQGPARLLLGIVGRQLHLQGALSSWAMLR